MNIFYASCQTPPGILHIVCSNGGIQKIILPQEKSSGQDAEQTRIRKILVKDFPDATITDVSHETSKSGICSQAQKELSEYFYNKRQEFLSPCIPQGTAFQQQVWDIVKTIPYGSTCTYGEIAEKLGDKKLSRAVGLANGANPIPIIIPCHRVIGKDGSLTGYGGGLAMKRYLLQLEGAILL